MEEQDLWRDIPGYEGFYQVSWDGRVRSCNRLVQHAGAGTQYLLGQELSQWLNKGYYKVRLCDENGKRIQCGVHRLVAMAWIPNPDNLPHVNHIDGNKTNNHWTNLEWCTPSGNLQHAYDNDLAKQKRGQASHAAKLTREQVLAIRADERSQRKIAADYGISRSAVHKIKTRKTWAHI